MNNRKTKTSTNVKRKYNERVYIPIYFQVPKETGELFKTKCAAEGKSVAGVLKDAIEEFLKK